MSDSRRRFNLLCFDGGGVRGVSSLVILSHIMHNLQQKVSPGSTTPLLPCDYFDMIAGTSTGGLIAVMLGILRMDVRSCITAYNTISKDVFPHEGFLARKKAFSYGKKLVGKARFDATILEQHIKRLIREQLKKIPTYSEKSDEELENIALEYDPLQRVEGPDCKVFVCVTGKGTEAGFRLRNYMGPEPSTGCTIWQALRATSAAPLIFDPISFGDPIPATYVDGALGMNNPIRALVGEAEMILRSHPERQVGCIISIGTGAPSLHSMGSTALELVDTLQRISTETETTAHAFEEEFKRLQKDPLFMNAEYFRFNVPGGIGDIPIEEWTAIPKINEATNLHMIRNREMMNACVQAIPSIETHTSILAGLPLSKISQSPELYGRKDLIRDIENFLSFTSSTTRGIVLWGLPGYGKTQLALNHMKMQYAFYDVVLWINAASQSNLIYSLKQNVEGLKIAADPRELSVQTYEPATAIHRFMSSVKNHLLQCKGYWLMVIDGVDDPYVRCEEVIPSVPRGHIIITTTRYKSALQMETREGYISIEIDGIDAVSGAQLLRGKVQDLNSSEDCGTLEVISRLLGGNPLALEQAAAMLATTIKPDIYIQLFRQHFELCRNFTLEGMPVNYEKQRSVFASLDLIYGNLVDGSIGISLLHVSSILGQGYIPVSLFRNEIILAASSPTTSDLTERLHDAATNSALLILALTELQKNCLIKITYDTSGNIIGYLVHNLVRHWIRAKISGKLRYECIVTAINMLGAFIDDGRNWAHNVFSTHLKSVIDCVEIYVPQELLQAPTGTFFSTCAWTAHCFGRFFLSLGDLDRSKTWYTMAVEYRRLKESTSRAVVIKAMDIRQQLATTCWRLGQLQEASEHLEFIAQETSRWTDGDGNDSIKLRSKSQLYKLRAKLDILEKAHTRARMATLGSKTRTLQQDPAHSLSLLRSISNPMLEQAESSQASKSIASVNMNVSWSLASDFELDWQRDKGNSDDPYGHIDERDRSSTDGEFKDALNSDLETDRRRVDPVSNSPCSKQHFLSDLNPPSYNEMPGEVRISCLASGWGRGGAQQPMSPRARQLCEENIPSYLIKYIPRVLPVTRDDADEEYETLVIDAIKDHSQQMNVAPNTILKAISSCAKYFDRTTPYILNAILLQKMIVIYRLSHIEDDFVSAQTVLNSWLCLFENEHENTRVAIEHAMSLSINLLRNYLEAEISQLTSTEVQYSGGILHRAVSLRLGKLVRRLLSIGADPSADDAYGLTPFMWALGRNVHPYIEENRHSILHNLIGFGARTSLEKATQADDYCVIDNLIRIGGHLNLPDENGETLLLKAVRENDETTLRYLESYNADPDIPSYTTGDTPLHIAVANYDYARTLSLLQWFGALPDSQNKNGDTPLHVAVKGVVNSPLERDDHCLKIIDLLLSYHADRTIRNRNGRTASAIAHAMGRKETVKALTATKAERESATSRQILTELSDYVYDCLSEEFDSPADEDLRVRLMMLRE